MIKELEKAITKLTSEGKDVSIIQLNSKDWWTLSVELFRMYPAEAEKEGHGTVDNFMNIPIHRSEEQSPPTIYIDVGGVAERYLVSDLQ